MGSDDDFIYAVRLEDDVARRKAGASARSKAVEHASDTSLSGRILDRLTDRYTDERAWRRGAEGEEEVARHLSELSDDWTVLHDITVGSRGANIDHLVIGSPGIFTLNTKHLTGKVWVGPRTFKHNRYRTDYLPKAVREGERASRHLSEALGEPVRVWPVIVPMGCELTVKQQPDDVSVIGRRDIRLWLESLPRALSVEAVADTSRVARLPSTWGQGEPAEVLDRRADAEGGAVPEVPDGVTVKRWRRFGMDRLYVNDADGQTMGYLDVVAGFVHAEDGVDEALLSAILQHHHPER